MGNISSKEREAQFNYIIRKCHKNDLNTKFLTHYDAEEFDPQDYLSLQNGETLLNVTVSVDPKNE